MEIRRLPYRQSQFPAASRGACARVKKAVSYRTRAQDITDEVTTVVPELAEPVLDLTGKLTVAVPIRAFCQQDAGTQQVLPGTGVSVRWCGQRDYLLSASTRRSTSSSTLPVLGRWRWSSRSLSSALVRPS
jgi:hypothetical protein